MDYAKILIIDDEPANVRLLERLLANAGYTRIRGTTDSGQSIALLAEFDPDIILLDLPMPHPDGFALLAQLKEELPTGAFLPVVVLTADATPEVRLRALREGAHDFLTKPFDHVEVVQRVGNLLYTRRLQFQLEAQKEGLAESLQERTQALEAALEELRVVQEQIAHQ